MAQVMEEREPTGGSQVRPLRVAVIGAGMAGILSAIKLQEAGLTDFTIYEKADNVGGTWRENTYPGLHCDVPSHLYSYSFALTPEWSRRFAPGPEIQAYFERVTEEHGIEEHIRFGDEVKRLEFRDGCWRLETASGHRDEADVVIAATGVLHHPKYPEIEGLDTFEGAAFHSARWDHDVDLEGKRVGVIGTGSTAIQIVSAIVEQVGHLCLFQRTAQWVLQLDNPPYEEEEKQKFREQPEELESFHAHLSEMFGVFANAVVDADSDQMAMVEQACRTSLEENVEDPELREALRPDYRAGCKRLVMSPDFYDKIQHPDAELVADGIERVEPGGVRTRDGTLHELDVLVLATGFNVDAFMRPMEVIGRGGVDLEQVWAKRPVAHLAVGIPDFPNLFMLNGPNGPVGNFSLVEVAELQFDYILQLVEQLRSGEASEISPTHEALERFEEERAEASQNTIWVTGCRSWYLDDRGLPAVWPWPFDRFRREMEAPNLDDYEVR